MTHTHLRPPPERQREAELSEFEASLVCIPSLRWDQPVLFSNPAERRGKIREKTQTPPQKKWKTGEPLKESLGTNHFQLRPRLWQQRQYTSFEEGRTSRQPLAKLTVGSPSKPLPPYRRPSWIICLQKKAQFKYWASSLSKPLRIRERGNHVCFYLKLSKLAFSN